MGDPEKGEVCVAGNYGVCKVYHGIFLLGAQGSRRKERSA